MKFYIIEIEGEVIDCQRTLKAARDTVNFYAGSDGKFSARITTVDVPVTAETVRRLLGNIGGYAKGVA